MHVAAAGGGEQAVELLLMYGEALARAATGQYGDTPAERAVACVADVSPDVGQRCLRVSRILHSWKPVTGRGIGLSKEVLHLGGEASTAGNVAVSVAVSPLARVDHSESLASGLLHECDQRGVSIEGAAPGPESSPGEKQRGSPRARSHVEPPVVDPAALQVADQVNSRGKERGCGTIDWSNVPPPAGGDVSDRISPDSDSVTHPVHGRPGDEALSQGSKLASPAAFEDHESGPGRILGKPSPFTSHGTNAMMWDNQGIFE